MITIACTCDQWPTPHQHAPPKAKVLLNNGNEVIIPKAWLELNEDTVVEILDEIPEEILPCVDWKQVAHDLMVSS